MIPFIGNVQKGKSIETESILVVTRGWGKEKWGVNANGVSTRGYENVLKLDTGDGCTIL